MRWLASLIEKVILEKILEKNVELALWMSGGRALLTDNSYYKGFMGNLIWCSRNSKKVLVVQTQ